MLPESYRRLLYIENAEAGSYINTGILPTDNTKVVVDGYVIDGDTAFIGERTGYNSSDAFTLQFTSEQYYRFNFNIIKVMAPTSIVKGIRHVFTVSKDGFYIDDNFIGAPSKKTIKPQYPFFMIGAMNTGGVVGSLGIVRIYSLQIYDGNDLIADYEPCVSEEGEYGMYECVSENFLMNEGTGHFTGEMEPFTRIENTNLPEKRVYTKGEEFDATGLVVEAFCDSGYHMVIDDYEIYGFDSETTGAQLVTVFYEGMSDEFAVVINDTPIPVEFITLEEMKQYLRVDFEDDDELIGYLIIASENRCMDVARIEEKAEFRALDSAKISVMYAVAYQYEHREDANLNDLNVSLRALLFGDRKVGF